MGKMYTIKELAKELNISPKTCYKKYVLWRVEGRLQNILRIGNRLRFPEADVKKLIKSFTMDEVPSITQKV